jgi:hypothetical protein
MEEQAMKAVFGMLAICVTTLPAFAQTVAPAEPGMTKPPVDQGAVVTPPKTNDKSVATPPASIDPDIHSATGDIDRKNKEKSERKKKKHKSGKAPVDNGTAK